MENLWEKSKLLTIQTGADIVGGFDVGFDGKIPEHTLDDLMDFVYWVEDRYEFPVTLWADFKYRYYLIGQDKKRVDYKFYWVDYPAIASFENYDDIPVIELPVRFEKRGKDEVLKSFIRSISHYFAWLTGEDMKQFQPDEVLVEEILHEYKKR